MNNVWIRFFYVIFSMSLAVPAAASTAGEADGAPLEHSEESFSSDEARENQKEVRDDLANVRISHQKNELAKKEVELNRKIYERTKKSYGRNDPLTKESKERYEKAQKSYDESHQEYVDAKKSLKQKKEERHQAPRGLLEEGRRRKNGGKPDMRDD